MKSIYTGTISAILTLFSFAAIAGTGNVEITITPDHAERVYALDEPVTFTVSVTRDKRPLDKVKLHYTIAKEKMKAHAEGEVTIDDGSARVTARGMSEPGFLTFRVAVEDGGTRATALCQVGYEPDKLLPLTDMPPDFIAYWNAARRNNEKIALNPVVERADEYSDDRVDCYRVRVDNYRRGAHLYAYLSVPRGAGPFPAVLSIPGSGVKRARPLKDLAARGVITLHVGIHGIPFTMADSIYADLRDGALHEYQFQNLDILDLYYYKRVIVGCTRTIDFLFTLSSFDGEHVGVIGESQGGGLAIITAAIDERVTCLVSFFPAMCDHVGYLYGRAGGSPHMFDDNHARFRTAARVLNSRYYDAANFARLVRVPAFFSWGYNDLSCPITSMYAAYNVVPAPKRLFLELDNGHARSVRQRDAAYGWLLENLATRPRE
jgi:cephalosporin-C deacetylase-like acetyl esterase